MPIEVAVPFTVDPRKQESCQSGIFLFCPAVAMVPRKQRGALDYVRDLTKNTQM